MSYTVTIKGLDKLTNVGSSISNVGKTAGRTTWNKEGKQLYNAINTSTRYKTGRLQRGNIMQITDTGIHYFNNVPYAGKMNSKKYRTGKFIFVTGNFEKYKDTIVLAFDRNFATGLKGLFK